MPAGDIGLELPGNARIFDDVLPERERHAVAGPEVAYIEGSQMRHPFPVDDFAEQGNLDKAADELTRAFMCHEQPGSLVRCALTCVRSHRLLAVERRKLIEDSAYRGSRPGIDAQPIGNTFKSLVMEGQDEVPVSGKEALLVVAGVHRVHHFQLLDPLRIENLVGAIRFKAFFRKAMSAERLVIGRTEEVDGRPFKCHDGGHDPARANNGPLAFIPIRGRISEIERQKQGTIRGEHRRAGRAGAGLRKIRQRNHGFVVRGNGHLGR